MLVETARSFWCYAQRLSRAETDRTREMIIDFEIIPEAELELDLKKKNLLYMLAARYRAAA